MPSPLPFLEQLWDSMTVKQEIEDLFGEYDPLLWDLDAKMTPKFKAHLEDEKPAIDFYRDEIGYVYQAGWNQTENDERTKYIVMADYAMAHGYKSAIDVGCGIGSGVVVLGLAGLDKVVGAEVNKPSMKMLKARVERFELDNVKIVDIYDKWTRHKADLAICTEVFEHVEDPIGLAHKIFKLIKPGGAMIASWSFVDMVGHLPEHFHLSASHPDTWLTEGFGKILIEDVGFVFDKWTWFNNTAWHKPVDPPTPKPESEEEEVKLDKVVEEIVESSLGSAISMEPERDDSDESDG